MCKLGHFATESARLTQVPLCSGCRLRSRQAGAVRRGHHHPGVLAAAVAARHGRQDVRATGADDRAGDDDLVDPVVHCWCRCCASYMLKGGKDESDTFVLLHADASGLYLKAFALVDGQRQERCCSVAVGLLAAAMRLLSAARYRLRADDAGRLGHPGARSACPTSRSTSRSSSSREALQARSSHRAGRRLRWCRDLGGGEIAGRSMGLPHESDPIATPQARVIKWPDGWTQDDIADAIREKPQVPAGRRSVDQPADRRAGRRDGVGGAHPGRRSHDLQHTHQHSEKLRRPLGDASCATCSAA